MHSSSPKPAVIFSFSFPWDELMINTLLGAKEGNPAGKMKIDSA